MERPNGRRRDQLRALPRTSLQENNSAADAGSRTNPLATELKDQAGREERDEGHGLLHIYRHCLRLHGYHMD